MSREHPASRRRREFLKATGRWASPFISPEPVIEHLNILVAAGGTWRTIGRAAGVGSATAYAIGAGKRAEVRSDVARKIMATRPEDVSLARVDVNGSRWRLRSLAAMGHSAARMARALDVDPETVRHWVDGTREEIRSADAAQVHRLWTAWGDKRPPERDKFERMAATQARKRAEAADWCTAANLDEEALDTPGYRARAHWQPALGTGVAEDYPLGLPARVRASEAEREAV